MDSKLWNLISAAVLLIGFAIQWGTFSSRVSNLERDSEYMLRLIERNAENSREIKELTGDIKALIQSHLAAHQGLR